MAPKAKDKKGAKGAKKPAATKASAGGERDPKTMTFEEREEAAGFIPRSGERRAQAINEHRDVCIEDINIQIGKLVILEGGTLQLTHGQKYGLIGRNGVGKSTLLKAVATREVKLPMFVNCIFVEQEVRGDDTTAIDSVVNADRERAWLIAEEKLLLDHPDLDPDGTHLHEVYERLGEIDADGAVTRASVILAGLGFDKDMQGKATKEFSGGWRMRIALAQALFCEPDLLLLDEPTNHLDVVALTWLEEFLRNWENTVVIVSHDRGFLNRTTQVTMWMFRKKLYYYGGNYDTFVKVRGEQMRHRLAMQDHQERRKAQLTQFIARFAHGHKKMARQAQSRMKMLSKLEEEMVSVEGDDSKFNLEFPETDTLPPPCISVSNVAFGWNYGDVLYENVDLGVDLDSRVAIVGENGAGKSTFLKLLTTEITPTHGHVSRHPKLRLATFKQHHSDMLDLEMSAVDYFRSVWPDTPETEFRKYLGRFGLSGQLATMPMKNLSGGQKSRACFAEMSLRHPHIMLFDEPTNHLDIETIESLAWAINKFTGGVVLVSHDERLISLVADELWVVRKGKGGKPGNVSIFQGDFEAYRKLLQEELEAEGLI